jgi:hypothetical protein
MERNLKEINSSIRIYCVINDIHDKSQVPTCKQCNKMKTFLSMYEGFKKSCSTRLCYQSTFEINKKRQNTAIKNFGSLKAAYVDTAQKTIQEKYNIDNISKLDWVKEKKKETSLKNWGTEYPWQSEKGKILQQQGVINKYPGVTNISQLDEIKIKKEETSLINWGVRNPSQSTEIRQRILEKNGKEYITPSGKRFLVDGNEYIVLDYLYKKYEENQITLQPKISIPYLDSENKSRVWFPDVLIYDSDKKYLIEIITIDFLATEICLDKRFLSTRNLNYIPFAILHNKNGFLFKLDLEKDRKWTISIIKGALPGGNIENCKFPFGEIKIVQN